MTYLLTAFSAGRWVDAVRVVLFAGAALLALRTSVLPPRAARLILIAVLTGSAVKVALALRAGARRSAGHRAGWRS